MRNRCFEPINGFGCTVAPCSTVKGGRKRLAHISASQRPTPRYEKWHAATGKKVDPLTVLLPRNRTFRGESDAIRISGKKRHVLNSLECHCTDSIALSLLPVLAAGVRPYARSFEKSSAQMIHGVAAQYHHIVASGIAYRRVELDNRFCGSVLCVLPLSSARITCPIGSHATDHITSGLTTRQSGSRGSVWAAMRRINLGRHPLDYGTKPEGLKCNVMYRNGCQ